MTSLLNPLSIDAEIAERLKTDASFREAFIRLWSQAQVATEIRKLRRKRRLRQGDVAALTGTGQSAVSRIERADYDGWMFKTLLEIAIQLRAHLSIQFIPIEDVAAISYSPDIGTDVPGGGAV
jgi:DNA-binding XRE family transcriptional regulator